jgi:hypothetical protein
MTAVTALAGSEHMRRVTEMLKFLTSPNLAIAVSVSLFLLLLGCLEIGYRIGLRHAKKYSEPADDGSGAVGTAVFGLLGLLLGFAFASGMSRLESRRELVVQEANAIGTAYLRLDLLPASDQPAMRALFRDYLSTRLRVYERLPDIKGAEQELARAAQMQQVIWSRAIISSRADSTNNAPRLLLLPALNEMIDITTARTVALHTHLPTLIFALLICVSLLSGLLAGYSMSKRKARSWLHILLFAGAVAITLYTVIDLDFPRVGLIRLRAADNALVQLRDSIR